MSSLTTAVLVVLVILIAVGSYLYWKKHRKCPTTCPCAGDQIAAGFPGRAYGGEKSGGKSSVQSITYTADFPTCAANCVGSCIGVGFYESLPEDGNAANGKYSCYAYGNTTDSDLWRGPPVAPGDILSNSLCGIKPGTS